MKKLYAGAAVAALLGGIAAFTPARAVDAPTQVDEAGRKVHRFAFENGNAVYHGPLDERLGLSGAVEASPKLGAPAAYAAAVDASLRRLGAPLERMAEGGDHGTTPSTIIEKGRDWNGDGTSDALALEYSQYGIAVAGLNGTSGERLWTWTTPSTTGYAQAAAVGNGENGVLAYAYSGIGAVGAAVPTLTVTALGRDGEVRWENTYRGQWVYGVGAIAGRNLPFLADIGSLTASSADDIVVGKATYLYTLGTAGSTRTTTEVYDGAAGAAVFSERSVWNSEGLEPIATPDVTGDGLDDVLLVGYSMLAALRGTDGQALWQRGGLPVHYREPSRLGDVTGDGRADLAVSTTLWDASDYYTRKTNVVDGANGVVTAVLDGTLATAAGDVSGDGKPDISTAQPSYDDETSTASVTYETFTAMGQSLGSQTYSQTDDWDTNTYIYVWQLGDLQGDGAEEWAHSINVYDDDGLRRADRGVVSGRTNLRLWSGKAGAPIGGSMDGNGDDLMQIGAGGVLAQDGTTGASLWVRQMPRYSAEDAWSLGDLDGDGRDDVGVLIFDYAGTSSYATRVLSGANGRNLWNEVGIPDAPPPPPVVAEPNA